MVESARHRDLGTNAWMRTPRLCLDLERFEDRSAALRFARSQIRLAQEHSGRDRLFQGKRERIFVERVDRSARLPETKIRSRPHQRQIRQGVRVSAAGRVAEGQTAVEVTGEPSSQRLVHGRALACALRVCRGRLTLPGNWRDGPQRTSLPHLVRDVRGAVLKSGPRLTTVLPTRSTARRTAHRSASRREPSEPRSRALPGGSWWTNLSGSRRRDRELLPGLR